MPREAPVTRAMREARGRVIEITYLESSPRRWGPIRREGYDAGRRSCLTLSRQRRPGVMIPAFRGADDLAKQLLDSGFALSARPGMTLRVSSPPPAATIAAAAARAASCR